MHDDTHELGTPVLILGAGERWVLDQVRRHGVAMFIATMTVAAALASGVVVAGWLLVTDGFDERELWVPAVLLGTIVPALLAPPLLLFSARLVARLDTAGQLLRISAITDPLTGVANRRGFFAALDGFGDDEEIQVAMVDVDSFKALNDRYGHAMGDDALRTVADWLVDLVGEHGIVGRIGGDEFAFAAPADRLRATPGRRRFRLDDVTFTVSVGSAVGSGAAPDAALLAADDALYAEKQSRPIVRAGRRAGPAERRAVRLRDHDEPE